MQRCSERAFARCPTRHLCGTRYEAIFADNSECAEFNKKVDSMPMTNADRIRTMSDNELEAFLIDIDLDKGMPFITDWGKWLQQTAEDGE